MQRNACIFAEIIGYIKPQKKGTECTARHITNVQHFQQHFVVLISQTLFKHELFKEEEERKCVGKRMAIQHTDNTRVGIVRV